MSRKARITWWGLLGLAVLAVAIIVTVGALRTHGDTGLGHWALWATVAAVPLTAVGVLLVIADKLFPDKPSARANVGGTEDELAAVVLAKAQELRSRLIGPGEAGDQPANVRFTKDAAALREAGGTDAGDLLTVLDYYQSLSPARLVVLGEPGAGKTVLAVELLVRLLEHREQGSTRPVPVLISAAAYDTALPWQEWLAGHLALRFALGKQAAARLVRDRRILPLVDGIDEMDADGSDRAATLIKALNDWMQGSHRAPIIVTCRRAEYRALKRRIDRATVVEMVPLSGDEAADYLRGQFLDWEEQDRWEPVLKALATDPGGPLAAQLATPWRMTLALTAFREGGDPGDLLPPRGRLTARAAKKYAAKVDRRLLESYIPSAIGLHDQAGRYHPKDVERWLTSFADGLAWQGSHDESGTDIRLDRWWETVGKDPTRVAHRAVAGLLGVGWMIAEFVTGHSVFSAAASACLCTAFMAGWAPEPQRLRPRSLLTRRGMLRVAWGLAAGLLTTFAARRTVGLAGGLTGGLAMGAALGLAGGTADNSPRAIGPRDLIRADGRYRLAVGLAFGVVGTFAGFLVGQHAFGHTALGLGFGFAFGVTFGISNWLSGGHTGKSSAWTRYYLAVLVSAARGRAPLRFGNFLDWAHEAGLLRVSGVAYQFRHRQLQDWLTRRDAAG